ncbi:MAG: hypothetical protein JWP91_3142 [Fibrobacteres bacterium]|nr:hypothetical protein [Fibrobacterota bacterium]
MKLDEFEKRLSTVSDAKLMQMLSSSRATGPEVAVKLILNEGKRRGMDGLDAPAEGAFDRAPGSETTAYPQEMAGYAGADAPAAAEGQAASGAEGAPGEGEAPASDAPATAPDWLNEETKGGMPMAVKILLLLIVVGAILGLAWKFTR